MTCVNIYVLCMNAIWIIYFRGVIIVSVFDDIYNYGLRCKLIKKKLSSEYTVRTGKFIDHEVNE